MPETLQLLTVDGVITVYTAGFMLTVAGWAMGWKIGVAIRAIKKM